MSAPLNLIRALLVAAVCAAMLATCAAAAYAQDAGTPTVTDPPAETMPPEQALPEPTPAPEPPAPEPIPVPHPEPPPPPPDPVIDPPPSDQVIDPAPPADHRQADSSTTQRVETSRDSAPAAPQSAAPSAAPGDQFAAPAAQLPVAGTGEDWAWTDQGDAFIIGTGGSRDSGGRNALASFTAIGSIATAVARVPALGSRERAARYAAQAYADGSALTVSDAGNGTGLFAGIFGGNSGGGAAVLAPTTVGMPVVLRLLHPDRNTAFRTSTVTWRPSAYAPPIERPG